MAVKLLLSRLAYEAIRESVTIGGSDLSYDSFTRREYTDNEDYAEKEAKVWAGINTALSRLSDYDRLPLFTEEKEVTHDSETGIGTITLPDECKEVLSVYYNTLTGYRTVPFSVSGENIVLHRRNALSDRKETLWVEYEKSFPHFSPSDITPTIALGENDPVTGTKATAYTDRNIDLQGRYHVTPEGFEYAKKLAEAEVMRIVDPSRANDLINMAENYFSDMNTYRPAHRQRQVGSVFTI